MTDGSNLVLFLFVRRTGSSISDLEHDVVIAYLAAVLGIPLPTLLASFAHADFNREHSSLFRQRVQLAKRIENCFIFKFKFKFSMV